MKGVVFVRDRKLELRDFPDPTPGPRDVVLEIKASGMCGSGCRSERHSRGLFSVSGVNLVRPLGTGRADDLLPSTARIHRRARRRGVMALAAARAMPFNLT